MGRRSASRGVLPLSHLDAGVASAWRVYTACPQRNRPSHPGRRGGGGGRSDTALVVRAVGEKKWAEERNYCLECHKTPTPPRGLTGGHTTVEGCAKGFVSQRCGGNRV